MLAHWDALAERHLERPDEVSGNLKVVAPVALGQLRPSFQRGISRNGCLRFSKRWM